MKIESLNESDTNLSRLWAKVFLELYRGKGAFRHPATATLDVRAGLVETPALRSLLDAKLKDMGAKSCKTVSGTIFPASYWNEALPNGDKELYARYDHAWPGIAKCPANRRGVYFRRLTSFGSSKVNQLDFVVKTYKEKGNHRKSALQAAILDPALDHTHNRVKGFPCMQQVSFTPLEDDGLSITGYYATQYQFEKAYGNYLGLYNLGRFMARQMDKELKQVVCIASALTLGEKAKARLSAFAKQVEKCAL
jgi:hypothetical protein